MSSFGIQIVSPDSPNDYVFAELIVSRLTGPSVSSSFYGELKERRWRRVALAALFVTLAAVAAYHAWPAIANG